MEPLVTAAEANEMLPGGGSLSQKQIDSIAEGIRNECGWHIAPLITETIELDSDGGRALRLPSLRVVGVEEVTLNQQGYTFDLEAGEVEWSKAGLLRVGRRRVRPGETWTSPFRDTNKSGFPEGYRAVSVTLTHGFEKCPMDLLRYILQAARQRISSETLVGRSVSFAPVDDIFSQASALDKYRLGQGL